MGVSSSARGRRAGCVGPALALRVPALAPGPLGNQQRSSCPGQWPRRMRPAGRELGLLGLGQPGKMSLFAHVRPRPLAQEGLTSSGSSPGAAFPSTLLAPSLTSGQEGPQRPAPFPWLIEETRPSEGRGGRWRGSQRPAGEGPGLVALQRPFSSRPATRLMPQVHASLSPASLRALRILLLQSQEWP